MDNRLRRFAGGDVAPSVETPVVRTLDEGLLPDALDTVSALTCEPSEGGTEAVDYDVLFARMRPSLIKSSRYKLRDKCTDPAGHCQEVVQQAMLKVWQAPNRPERGYEHAARVLRKALEQEARWHKRICGREEPFDFNARPGRRDDPDAADRNGHKGTADLGQQLFVDPTEVLISLLDLQERLPHLSDEEMDLVVMVAVEELALSEIAERRGCSVWAAWRAISKLRKKLGKSTAG